MTQFGTYWTSLEINEPFILECRESNIIFGSQKNQSLSNCFFVEVLGYRWTTRFLWKSELTETSK